MKLITHSLDFSILSLPLLVTCGAQAADVREEGALPAVVFRRLQRCLMPLRLAQTVLEVCGGSSPHRRLLLPLLGLRRPDAEFAHGEGVGASGARQLGMRLLVESSIALISV